MDSKYSDNAKVYKAFCDENRLMILEMLQSGEKCACILLENLPIAQSTLSHHMKILVESGVVSARREGKWTHYSFSETGVAYAKKLIGELTRTKENDAWEGLFNGKNMGFFSNPNTWHEVVK